MTNEEFEKFKLPKEKKDVNLINFDKQSEISVKLNHLLFMEYKLDIKEAIYSVSHYLMVIESVMKDQLEIAKKKAMIQTLEQLKKQKDL